MTVQITSPLAKLIEPDVTLHLRGSDAWLIYWALREHADTVSTKTASELAETISEALLAAREAKEASA